MKKDCVVLHRDEYILLYALFNSNRNSFSRTSENATRRRIRAEVTWREEAETRAVNAVTSCDWSVRVQNRIKPRRRTEMIHGRKIPPVAESLPLADVRFSPKPPAQEPNQVSHLLHPPLPLPNAIPTSSCRTAIFHHRLSLSSLVPYFYSFLFSSIRSYS